jgi:hypothetical protein
MNDRVRREKERAQRSYLFLDENKNDFTSITVVAANISILQTEIQKLDELGADKVSATTGSKDVTIHRGDLRDALRDAMQDVSDMWKPMAKNYENAHNKFRMPYGSDQLLIDTAGSFIEEATPLEADFIARGMDENFIADLTAKRDAFAASIDESDDAKLDRVGVNAQFSDPVRKCRAVIEDVDPIVKMVYRDNPGKLAEWLSASRVERPPKKANLQS